VRSKDALEGDRKARLRLQREQEMSGVTFLAEPVQICRDAAGPFGPFVCGVTHDAAASVKAEWLP
jgi:hypothetical protein